MLKPANNRPEGVVPPPASIFHAGRHEPPTRRAVALRGNLPGNVGSENHATEGFESHRLQVNRGRAMHEVSGIVNRGSVGSYAPKKFLVFPVFRQVDSWTKRAGIAAEAMEALLAEFAQRNALTAARHQVTHNLTSVRRFFRGQGIHAPGQITRRAVYRHLAALADAGLSPKTIRNHQGAISHFCLFLVDNGQLAANPCLGIKCAKIEKKPPLYLDDRERAQALAIARAEGIYAEVSLAINTGMRMNELRLLKWGDVELDRRTLLVRKSKSKRPRTIPLNKKAVLALRLQRRRTGRFLHVFAGGRGNCAQGLGSWGRNHPRRTNWWATESLKPLRAKIGKFSQMAPGSVGRGWHLLRHSFATRAVRAGIPIYQVSKWLGHAHVTTTEIYAHAAEGYDEQIERI